MMLKAFALQTTLTGVNRCCVWSRVSKVEAAIGLCDTVIFWCIITKARFPAVGDATKRNVPCCNATQRCAQSRNMRRSTVRKATQRTQCRTEFLRSTTGRLLCDMRKMRTKRTFQLLLLLYFRRRIRQRKRKHVSGFETFFESATAVDRNENVPLNAQKRPRKLYKVISHHSSIVWPHSIVTAT